ncbi:Protein of unknown function, partial [Gryllus bimaculatus]
MAIADPDDGVSAPPPMANCEVTNASRYASIASSSSS